MRTCAHVWKTHTSGGGRRRCGRNRTGANDRVASPGSARMTRRDPSAAATPSTAAVPNILTFSLPARHSLSFAHGRKTDRESADTRKRPSRGATWSGREREWESRRKKGRYYVWHKSWHMRFLTHLSTVIYTQGDDRFPSRRCAATGGCGGVCGYDDGGREPRGGGGRRVKMKEFHLHGFFFYFIFESVYFVDGVKGGS